MNHNIEKNNSLKKRLHPKNIFGLYLSIFKRKNINEPEKRLKDGGYIAWPESTVHQEKIEKEVKVGRTKDGGYIAYPNS